MSSTRLSRYAVFGNPIAHSLSPIIHHQFAQQTEKNIEYSRQLVPNEQFAENARDFFDNDGDGLNVTAPFKLDAYQFADVVSDRARLAAARPSLPGMEPVQGDMFGAE